MVSWLWVRAQLIRAFGHPRMMNLSKRKSIITIIAVYLLAIILCMLFAFDFAGTINFNMTLMLIGLTLPWSLVWAEVRNISAAAQQALAVDASIDASQTASWRRRLKPELGAAEAQR